MQPDGYALIEDVANSCHTDAAQILEVTQAPGKLRFQTLNDGQNVWIRATHGHTLKTVDVKSGLYQEIKAPLPVLVHAVSGDSVPMVLAKGLNRGGRPHVLFAISDEEDKLKQGFQDSCNILVYVNMAKAMFAGIPFNWAPDGMVVSVGLPERKSKNRWKTEKAGTIPPDFILRVANRNEKSGAASAAGLAGHGAPGGILPLPEGLEPRTSGQNGYQQNPSQDLLRMVTGGVNPPAPAPASISGLRPHLKGEPAEASAEAYEKLKQLMQLQQQEAHARQMLELSRLKEQHNQILQAGQMLQQQQQQIAQRNAQRSLLDTALQVEDLSRQLEATQAAVRGGLAGAPTMYAPSPEASFPPHLQHLFGLAAQAVPAGVQPRLQ